MGESLSEFMERRRREVAVFGRAAEAAAHEAYGKALRVGRDLQLGTSGEVVRFGANLLSGSKLKPTPSTRPGVAVFRPGTPQPAKGTRLPRGLDMMSWQGKALGLKKYGLPERIWHGSPAPLKARVGGVGGSTGGLLYSDPDDENAQ